MYESATESVRDTQKEETVLVRLAVVTSLDSSNRAFVQFYGEDEPSTKLYPYIDGYVPVVDDVVGMLKQGDTYIILGKVTKDAAGGESIYLTKTEAAELYAAIDHTHTEYAKTLHTHTTLGNSSESFLSASSTGIVPGTGSSSPNLGSASQRWSIGYIESIRRLNNIYFGSASNATFTATVSGGTVTLTPQNGTILGTSSGAFGNVYSSKFYCGGSYPFGLDLSATSSSKYIWPSASNVVDLGSSSKQFKGIYGKTLYSNGTAVSSDANVKKDVENLDEKYVEFFKKLRPVEYRYIEDDEQTHTGFIAQEVESAAEECGITDSAMIHKNEGRYYLNYSEVIAIQTSIIQNLIDRVEKLEGGEK